MKEKIPILIFCFLFIISATSIIARPVKSVDVLLTPTEFGKPSKIVPLSYNTATLEVLPVRKNSIDNGGPGSTPFSVDMVLAYDNGTELSSLGGLASGFHLGVWFKSPSACTLLAIYYYFAAGGAVTYYVSDPADSIDFENDYEEYHGGVNPGPNPIETYLHPDTSVYADSSAWDTLDITSMPDVAKNIFFAAYIMDDGVSSPIIDASVSPPYHTIMQRTAGGGGPFGWYSSWHHVYIRALVRMYENPPPSIDSYDKLANTYLTTGREVTATLSDLGIPLDSTGVTEAWVYYSIDSDTLWDSLAMTIISGDSSSGVWKAILPGINAGQTMDYYITCFDMQGLENLPAMNPASYTIKEKIGDVLFVNDDYYGGGYSYDVISDVIPTADWWDIPSDGSPDNSVLNAGYNIIIWNSWEYSGASFADAQSLIEDYLDGGGNLLVSAMDIPAGEFGYSWGDFTTEPGEFLYDYFGIRGGTDDFANPDAPSVYFGRTGDEITAVFNEDWPITSLPYYFVGTGYNYAGKFDEPVDTTQWKGILYDEWGYCSAFRFEQPGVYKVVWLFFPFAYIYDYANPYTPEIQQQQELIGRILDWFDNTPSPALLGLTRYYTTVTPGPYSVSITVTNFTDSLLAVDLIVLANGVEDTIPMTETKSGVEYSASIPAYASETDISYHVEAMDSDSLISSSVTYNFWFLVPTANVLYVNEAGDPQLDYMDVLDSLSISGGYDVYDPAVQGIPDATVLPSYATLIWNGDWGYGTILTKSSVGNVLYDYMLTGGNIFFNSDEILGLWDGWANVAYEPGEFPYDVLKVTYIYNDICYDSVYGITGDPITDGIIAEMTFPLTNWNDEVDIDTTATSIFTDAAATTCRGVRWSDSLNKVVFLPFMYVALPKSDQITVLGNVLTWFGTTFKFSSDDKGINIPKVFAISQNSPNPFNERTNILYSIPKKTNVSLKIYNSAGQLVRTLVNGVEEPGYKTVYWDGLDRNQKRVAQGVYFYRLSADNFHATKKLLVLR